MCFRNTLSLKDDELWPVAEKTTTFHLPKSDRRDFDCMNQKVASESLESPWCKIIGTLTIANLNLTHTPNWSLIAFSCLISSCESLLLHFVSLCVLCVNQRWLEFCLQCDYNRDWKGENPPHFNETKLSAEQVNHISQLHHYNFKLIKEEEQIYIALSHLSRQQIDCYDSQQCQLCSIEKVMAINLSLRSTQFLPPVCLPSIRYLNPQKCEWMDFKCDVTHLQMSSSPTRFCNIGIGTQPMCSNLTPNLIKCVTCPMPIIIAITWWWGTGD